MDTTGLVNESYLRVAGAGAKCEASRGQCIAYAARTMRSVVVDLIREGQAQRRSGDLQRVTLSTAIMDAALAADEPLTIDEALKALATVEPRLCQVVELRYYNQAGRTGEA